MSKLKQKILSTPWNIIRLFAPLVTVTTLVIYYLTRFIGVYPGEPALYMVNAARLVELPNLLHPLFQLTIRVVAKLPIASLDERLNLFCVICGALAATLFYLFVARLIFILAFEDPGGAMAAMPPQTSDTPEQDDPIQPLPQDIPDLVHRHNRIATVAAIIGGLTATLALALSAPFWISATRLYPHTFHLMLFFAIINLLLTYDQRSTTFSLLGCGFLATLCMLESPLFIILAPLCGLLLLRSMKLNAQANAARILSLLLIALSGAILSAAAIFRVSRFCAPVSYPSYRSILRTLESSIIQEALSCIPSTSGWSLIFIQFLLPCALAFFVFNFAFTRRITSIFLLELGLLICLLPSLLNLDFSPWGIARLTTSMPIYTYTVIATFVGLIVAAWFLMREVFVDGLEEDRDFYEYRDNPLICRIGAFLCWPLIALVLIQPLRTFQDVDPKNATFADQIATIIYQNLEQREWLVNSNILTSEHTTTRKQKTSHNRFEHHLLLTALKDNRHLKLISTIGSESTSSLLQNIRGHQEDPATFYRLVNSATISPSTFIRELLASTPDAYSHVAVFRDPTIWDNNNYLSLPNGFFLKGLPPDSPINLISELDNFNSYLNSITPYIAPLKPDRFPLFTTYRKALRQQLTFIGNQLALHLHHARHPQEAMQLLDSIQLLDQLNLSVMLNRYHLATSIGNPETTTALEEQLRQIPRLVPNLHNLTPANLASSSGTLISTESLDFVRKAIWAEATDLKVLGLKTSQNKDPLTAFANRKVEIYQAIHRHIDSVDLDSAESLLNILLDIDDKDPNIYLLKATIAIDKKDLPETGVWLDLARENKVNPDELIWLDASLLYYQGELQAARDMVNDAIPADLSNIRLWGLLAHILIDLNEYDELETRVLPAMRIATSRRDHYLFHYVQGKIAVNDGVAYYSLARNAYQRALSLNPSLDELREELLQIDDQLSIPAFSEQDATAILIHNPDHPFANYLLGMVRLERGQLGLAQDLFQRSLSHAPSAQAYAGMGTVKLFEQSLDEAEKLTRQALSLNPDLHLALHTLARIKLQQGNYDKAAAPLAKVLKAKPDDLYIKLTQIRLLIAQDQLERAALLTSQMKESDDLIPHAVSRQLNELVAELTRRLAP